MILLFSTLLLAFLRSQYDRVLRSGDPYAISFWRQYSPLWVGELETDKHIYETANTGGGQAAGVQVFQPDYIAHVYYDDDLPHYCGDCGHKLQLVRPGKWQCDHCEG